MQALHLYPQTQSPYPHKGTYSFFVRFPYRLPEGNQDLKHDHIHSSKFTGTQFYFYETIMWHCKSIVLLVKIVGS